MEDKYMRNAKATQERILNAAMVEFSAYGIAGARVDRIAKTAGCNKNLIYVYFESKEKLFTAILQKHLLSVYEAVTFSPDDLPGYATRVFEFAITNPDLMRLMAWFSLEQKVNNPAERDAAHAAKLAAVAKAQSDGQVNTNFPPEFLLTAIMALSTAWAATNPFSPALDLNDVENLNTLKTSITNAIKLIVESR
jgi:AcrR family transcriptional regulator